MAKIIIEGSSVAELIALALSMQSGAAHTPSIAPMPVNTSNITNDDEDEGPTNANAPQFDSSGLPWDARIHASSKATNTDGTWRGKRKVSKEEIARVEAELRGAQGGQQNQQFTQQQPVQQMPMQQNFQQQPNVQPVNTVAQPQMQMQQPVQQMPMQQNFQQQPMQQMQQPVQNQQPQLSPVPQDFQTFMQAVSAAMSAGRVDQNYLANVAANHQLTAITDAAARPDLIPTLFNYMRNEGRM